MNKNFFKSVVLLSALSSTCSIAEANLESSGDVNIFGQAFQLGVTQDQALINGVAMGGVVFANFFLPYFQLEHGFSAINEEMKKVCTINESYCQAIPALENSIDISSKEDGTYSLSDLCQKMRAYLDNTISNEEKGSLASEIGKIVMSSVTKTGEIHVEEGAQVFTEDFEISFWENLVGCSRSIGEASVNFPGVLVEQLTEVISSIPTSYDDIVWADDVEVYGENAVRVSNIVKSTIALRFSMLRESTERLLTMLEETKFGTLRTLFEESGELKDDLAGKFINNVDAINDVVQGIVSSGLETLEENFACRLSRVEKYLNKLRPMIESIYNYAR
jgi:uncharacterized protein YicC (UPF0701 family)